MLATASCIADLSAGKMLIERRLEDAASTPPPAGLPIGRGTGPGTELGPGPARLRRRGHFYRRPFDSTAGPASTRRCTR